MNLLPPVPPEKHRFIEGMIRVVDLVIYAAITVGGFYALLATPESVVRELGGDSILVYMWSAMLLIGGSIGFIGRLSRRWMIEVPATVLSFAGALIYAFILLNLALANAGSIVAMVFTLIAALILFRRWSELQIFASTARDTKEILIEAARRKTSNYPRHS